MARPVRPKRLDRDLLTVWALAERIGCDRKTVSARVRKLQPAKIEKGHKLYRLSDVEEIFRAEADAKAPGLDKLKAEKMAEEVRRLKQRNDREAHVLVERALVVERLAEFFSWQVAALRQKIENEYPAKAAMMTDPGAVRVLGKRIVDELCRDHQKKLQELMSI